jgi:hypothetical protein
VEKHSFIAHQSEEHNMNAIKYGVVAAAFCLSTAAFAASDGTISGGQPGATSQQTDVAPAMKMNEGRAAKTSPTNSPKDAPTGVGGAPNSSGTPAAPNNQGN